MVMDAAKAITSEPLPPPAAIAEADERLNLALVATLFNARHGLAGLSEDIDGQLDQFAQWLESYKITVGWMPPHLCELTELLLMGIQTF